MRGMFCKCVYIAHGPLESLSRPAMFALPSTVQRFSSLQQMALRLSCLAQRARCLEQRECSVSLIQLCGAQSCFLLRDCCIFTRRRCCLVALSVVLRLPAGSCVTVRDTCSGQCSIHTAVRHVALAFQLSCSALLTCFCLLCRMRRWTPVVAHHVRCSTNSSRLTGAHVRIVF